MGDGIHNTEMIMTRTELRRKRFVSDLIKSNTKRDGMNMGVSL